MWTKYHKVVIKTKQAELVLKMYAEVDIFNAVNNDVYELHACHLQWPAQNIPTCQTLGQLMYCH